MDGTDGEAALGEIVGDFLGCALGAGEDHRRAAAFGLQNTGDHLGLVERVCTVDVLAGAIVHRGGFGLFGADVRRLRQEGASQGDDRAGHRRGEEHRLTLVGDHAHEAFDVGEESQVEHFVGLVEDENAHLAQDQVRLVGEVEQATRGADDNVDALLECRDLRLVRTAAVDGQNLETAVATRRYLLAFSRSRATWMHSSRVGTMIRARGVPSRTAVPFSAVTMRCRSGTPKPKVLPIPVRA